MVRVRFLEKCSPYNAGEVAGFRFAEAERLVRNGVAQYEEQPTAKQLDAPPVHAMLEAPTVKKAALPGSKAPATKAKPKETRR
jgi:hypothetical protein